MSVKIVVAHHPYEAQREDEISFDKDEVIKVTDFSDPDWWVGKKKDGSLGFFPSNFVTAKDDNEAEEKPKEEAAEEQEEPIEQIESKPVADGEQVEKEEEEQPPVEEKKVDQVIGMARVMEDYAMNEPGELTLHRGGIINVYEVIDGEWSRGELNGKVGKYPSKYVEDIDMPGRLDLGKQQSNSSDVQRSTSGDEDASAPKAGFKLAAFGVKQGGIGSLLAGGFPGLKKTGGVKPQQQQEEEQKPKAEPKPVVAEPVVPETKPEEAAEPAVVESPTPIVEQPNAEESVEKQKSLGKAIVLHPYDAESEDELSLLRGEYVEILDRNADEGWWKGLNERGQSGVFPSNFVREIEEESVVPPTPTRARRSAQSTSSNTSSPVVPPSVPSDSRPTLVNNAMARPPQVSRPASVQSPATARPISVQTPAQRPSSISHTTSSTSMATPPKLFPIAASHVDSPPAISEETKEEQEEEEKPVVPPIQSVEQVQSPPVVERKFSEDSSIKAPPAVEHKASLLSEESVKSPVVVKEDPISDEEEKESGVEEIAPVAAAPVAAAPVAAAPVAASREIKPVEVEEPKEEETKVEPIVEKKEPIVEEKKEEEPVVVEENKEEEKKDSIVVQEEDDNFKDAGEHTAVAEEKPVVTEKEEEKGEEEEKKEEEEVPVIVEEEKNEFDIIPTGPKLTTPARARIGGRARRSPPTAVSHEPSQTEILQKELEETPEEEKPVEEEKPATPSPPAKPVKPIFAKFPTPFAAGADVISKTHLKPTQTRRLWEDKPAESAPSAAAAASTEEEPVRPSGVKNIASRFNFAGNSTGGSNEVLETKLKNHTKNEVEKVRKEFEQLLNEEKEKRLALENIVNELLEKVKALEQ